MSDRHRVLIRQLNLNVRYTNVAFDLDEHQSGHDASSVIGVGFGKERLTPSLLRDHARTRSKLVRLFNKRIDKIVQVLLDLFAVRDDGNFDEVNCDRRKQQQWGLT